MNPGARTGEAFFRRDFASEDVEEVKWIGLETAKRLHKEEEGAFGRNFA